jgi:hypothetical protein
VNPDLQKATFKDAGTPLTVTKKFVTIPPDLGVLIRKDPGLANTQVDEVRYTPHWREVAFKPQAAPTPVPAKPAASAKR